MKNIIATFKRVFFWFSMIGLISALMKASAVFIALDSRPHAESSHLAQDVAQWFVIALVWFVLFLIMKAVEYVVIRDSTDKPTSTSSSPEINVEKESSATTTSKIVKGTHEHEVHDYKLGAEPLNSGEQMKLLFFALLLAPTVFLVLGIVPTILIAIGLYLMKKNQDFSSLETAVGYVKVYIWLVVIGFGLGSMVGAISWGFGNDDFYGPFMVAVIASGFLVAVNQLFYHPLKNHREWVEVNGIFPTKPKSTDWLRSESEIDIIKGENLKQYSAADELIKWAKLKDDGHISEEDFNEARAKLLKKT